MKKILKISRSNLNTMFALECMCEYETLKLE